MGFWQINKCQSSGVIEEVAYDYSVSGTFVLKSTIKIRNQENILEVKSK